MQEGMRKSDSCSSSTLLDHPGDTARAMSQENIETIRRCDEAISRGDTDVYLLGIDRDVVFIPRRAAVEGAYYGHDGMRKYIAENADSYELFEVRNTEFHDLGDRTTRDGLCTQLKEIAHQRTMLPELSRLRRQ